MPAPQDIQLTWEVATGYDFFASLHVLHDPADFGLRGAWAKGVRARLPRKYRTFFEDTAQYFLAPIQWIYELPGAKDSKTILRKIENITPSERFLTMIKSEGFPSDAGEILNTIAEQRRWTPADQDALASIGKANNYPMPADKLVKMLNLWANAREYGDIIFEAFQTYYDVFFAEEESRIRPALQRAAEEAQEKASQLELHDLLVELSEGVRFDEKILRPEIVMIPSFWISPLTMMNPISPARGLFLFGGRPADASLVPGEAVPDALFRTLKALADPTRMRILRLLEEETQTPSELAKSLRLRAPTVIHHLNNLRLAGLVYVEINQSGKRYAARLSRVDEMYGQLRRYLVKQRPTGDAIPEDMGDITEQVPRVA